MNFVSNLNSLMNIVFLVNAARLTNIIDLGIFNFMEEDIFNAVTGYGPEKISIVLFQYSFISSSNLKIIGLLSQYLPLNNVSIILVEILADNIKDTTRIEDFINFLGNISSLHYLYKKFYTFLG